MKNSDYKGVHQRQSDLRYVATIKRDKETLILGSYTDPVQAAERFDLASICFYGHTLQCNFPKAGYTQAELNLMRRRLVMESGQLVPSPAERHQQEEAERAARSQRLLNQTRQNYREVVRSFKLQRAETAHFYLNNLGQAVSSDSYPISLC